MKKFILWGVIGIVFGIIAYSMWQPTTTELYVARDGKDDAKGTKSEPIRTLREAANRASAGTIVYVREGTYEEPLQPKHSGTEENPIVFRAYGKEHVLLAGTKLRAKDGIKALVTIENRQFITIEGFTLQEVTTKKAEQTAIGLYVTGDSQSIVLKNNHIQNIRTTSDEGNAHGIAIYGTDAIKHITIEGNTLENLTLGASEALVLNGNIQHFMIDHNTIRHSNNIGIDVIGHEGIAKKDSDDFVRDGTIRKNTIHDISSYGNPAYGNEYSAGGIYVDGAKNVFIEENEVYHSDLGIEATSEHAGKYAENITIRSNDVHDNYYTGISIGGYDEQRGGTRNSKIVNNQLVRNDTKNLEGGQLLVQYDAKNNVIEDNDFIASNSMIFVANYFQKNEGNTFRNNHFSNSNGIWIWKDEQYDEVKAFEKAVE